MMIDQMRKRGCFQREIAAAAGVSERSVRRALHRGGAPARRRGGKRGRKLAPFLAEVDRLLAEEVWNGAVIMAELRAHGYTGGRTILCDYIRPKRVLRRAVAGTVRFETAPGRQLQHDWGEIVVELAGVKRKIYFAVNTLGYSRRFHVFAAPKCDAEHTYESLVRAFAYFGGVTAEVWVDNQKAAVIEHTGERLRFNPAFVMLAEHYGFAPKACRPHRPQTKGKDERMVGYVKHNFFVRYRRFESFAHLNQLLERWLAEVADRRCHGTVKEVVAVRFERECPALAALPRLPFDTSYRQTRRVALDAFIEVGGNRYSVPAHLVGATVAVRIGLDATLKVFDAADVLVATHRLHPAAAGWQIVPEHHRRLWQSAYRVPPRALETYEEVLSCN